MNLMSLLSLRTGIIIYWSVTKKDKDGGIPATLKILAV